MKIVVALGVLAAVLTPAAYAVGQAHDPRVPALEKRLATMQKQVRALREQAAIVETNFIEQNVDQKVLALCQALIAARRSFSPLQLEVEPAFSAVLTGLTDEGSATFACPPPASFRR